MPGAQQAPAKRRDEHDPNSLLQDLAAPAAPVPKKEERSEVSPLQTYKSDVERSIEDRGVSVVSIAAAEAERRGKQAQTPEAKKEEWKIFGMNLVMVLGGVVLIAAALGVIAYLVLRPTTVAGPQTPAAPLVTVDDTAVVLAESPSTRDALVTSIASAVQNTRLSIGLIEWLYIGNRAADGSLTELPVQTLLGTLSPNLPPELARTLQPTYLLGVHSFDQNQAFLLLQVDSYGTAYAGMLAWERTMRGDLNPVFNRTPSPQINSATTSPAQAASIQQFIQTGFVDKVAANRDTRALLNDSGDILLLWTMLGRNIILITTNEFTLREVVARMNVAPIVPILGR